MLQRFAFQSLRCGNSRQPEYYSLHCLGSTVKSPSLWYPQRRTYAKKTTVTLIPGDGIGSEISESMRRIFATAAAPIEWDVQQVTPDGGVSQSVIDSVRKNKVGIKGPLGTPIGKGHRSLNLALRQEFDLYANVRPAKTVVGAQCYYQNVDLVTIRENTEGEYSGIEHKVVDGVHESMKIITHKGSTRIADYAFQYARRHGRKQIAAVHVASVMRLADGLFIETCKEVSSKYPDIVYDESTLANVCMKLAMDPAQFDMMVLPNLYGDVVSDLCAGLIGGLGLTPSGNIGDECAIFESVHGTAPDIAGKNLANPTALVLSGVMMLRHMRLDSYAECIESAILETIKEQKFITRDLGGSASSTQFVDVVCRKIETRLANSN